MRRDPQMSFLQAWVRCFSRERKKEKKETLFWGFKLTTTSTLPVSNSQRENIPLLNEY